MKIKLQAGGVVSYTPFIPNSETATSSSKTSKTSDTKKDKITGTLQEEIIKVLKENGLQSDVDAFLGVADSLLTKSSSLSSMSLFGGNDDNYTMSHLMNVLSLANKVKRNKEQWTNAVAQLKDQGAAHEVAMSSDGGIYVRTKEGLKSISPEEYYNNKDKYHGRAITNSQLLGLREMDPNLAFNFDILSDVSGSIGMKTISDTLVDIISKFGNNTLQGYVQKTGENVSKSVWDGMQALINNGPDGYYKAKSKSEKDDVTNAVKYLWRSLGSDGQKRLAAETAISGGNPNKDYIDIILEAFNLHTDYELTADFDKSASDFDPDGDKKGNNGDGSLGEVPYLVRIGRGDGEYEMVNISKRTDKVMNSGSLVAWGANMGDLVDKNGSKLGMDTLPNILGKTEAILATNSKDITFGGQLLTDIEKNYIIYDGSSQLTDVWLPYKNIGGKITPDFEALERFNQWNDWVNNNKNATKIDKINKAVQLGLDPDALIFNEADNSWTFDRDQMMLFLNFSAYADEDNVSFTKLTEDITERVPNDQGKQIKDVLNNLLEYGKLHRQKSDKGTGLNYDKIRRWNLRHGNIFIPIKSEFLSTHMSMKEYMPKSQMNRFASRSTLAKELAKMQNNNISSLGQFK